MAGSGKIVIDVEFGPMLEGMLELMAEQRWRENHGDEDSWGRMVRIGSPLWQRVLAVAESMDLDPEEYVAAAVARALVRDAESTQDRQSTGKD